MFFRFWALEVLCQWMFLKRLKFTSRIIRRGLNQSKMKSEEFWKRLAKLWFLKQQVQKGKLKVMTKKDKMQEGKL